MSVQVLIVGAGPTGLALACQCLRLGLSVRIIDKKAGRSETSKAIGLQYRVSEILACMGVVNGFLRRSGSPTTVNIYADSRKLVSLQFRADGHASGKGAFAPRPLMIAQSETEELLLDAVRERGGRIEWSTELTDLAQSSNEVTASVRLPSGSQETITCEWLASCEGAHSITRRAAGIEFSGKTYPLSFLMADVELHGHVAPAENHVWLHRDGSFAALPFPQRDRWRLFVEITRQPHRASGSADLDEIRQLMRERTGNARLSISHPSWISPFSINCRMVERYRVGRLLLAGDAAHIHSPTGGQGIATGIQDAVNLAWKLARVIAGAPIELLDTYEEERRSHAREVLRETDRTTTIFFAPTLLTRLLRDWIVLPLLRSAWIQRRMFAKLSQLHVHYRNSSLSVGHRPFWRLHTGLRPGDRAPDLLLQGDRQSSLFELLRRGRPVMLIGPGTAARRRIRAVIDIAQRASVDAWIITDSRNTEWKGDSKALVDVHNELQRIYGLRGQFLCLVRPDDHIGLLQSPIDEPKLRQFLRKIAANEFLEG